jgi:hypothetical protein
MIQIQIGWYCFVNARELIRHCWVSYRGSWTCNSWHFDFTHVLIFWISKSQRLLKIIFEACSGLLFAG